MKLLTTFATIFILGSFAIPTSTLAQTDEDNAAANALFVEAARTYAEANAASGRERVELLREVASTLGLISEQYPGTLPARRIEERTLGSIDLARIEAAVEPQGYEAIPSQVATAIELTAERACGEAGASSCKSELSEALVEYIAVLAFDLDRASDVEQLSWLFSNPGRFNDNLARVNAFSDLLEDNAFRDDFIERVNRRVISDMAVEATADLAFSLLTGVVSETLAQHYESQGYDEAAEFTRTWMEPIVDASLVLEGASTASTAGAGVGATIVWAKNAYAFWQLGEKQYRAEQTGATADQQLELLAAKIDSYTRTLISGRLTGVAFEGSEGAPLTGQHAEVIKSSLEQLYELQQYWLNSDDAVLLETFDAVLNLARAFYETLGRLSEPTPLNAADGSGALPPDLQGLGLQPAPDGFLGLPTIPKTSKTGDGLIGHWVHKDLVAMSEISDSGVPACTTVGDGLAWQITPERISFYESSCSFPSPLAADQTVYGGVLACSGEGQNWSEAVNIERLGQNLTYYSNDHVQELVACTPPAAEIASGDVVWGVVENDAEQEMVASPENSQCTPADEPLNTGGIFDFLVSKRIQGRTASGNDWSLWLNDDRPSNFGEASFTNAAGDVSAGVWYVGGTDGGGPQLCQSYNGGASYVCHGIYSCTSPAHTNFAMKNESGEISSTITTQSGGTPPSLAPRSNAILTEDATLTWAGSEQGIVGTFRIIGEKEEDGIRLSLTSASMRYNANARANPVESGARFELLMSASPRKLCEGCRPQDSFTSDYGLTFENNRLNGPTQPMTLLVPNDVLENNDVISISLRGTNNTIYITDTTLRISELMRLAEGRQSSSSVTQSNRGTSSAQNINGLSGVSMSNGTYYVDLGAVTSETLVGLFRAFGSSPEATTPVFGDASQFEARRLVAEVEEVIALAESAFSGRRVIVNFFEFPVNLGNYDFDTETFFVCGTRYTPLLADRRFRDTATMFLKPYFPTGSQSRGRSPFGGFCEGDYFQRGDTRTNPQEPNHLRAFGEPHRRSKASFMASIPASIAERFDQANRLGLVRMSHSCEMFPAIEQTGTYRVDWRESGTCNVTKIRISAYLGGTPSGEVLSVEYDVVGDNLSEPIILR